MCWCSGKPKPLPSGSETQEETRVQMDWPRWINHPDQIGDADPFDVQRVVWWHWGCNPKRFWRDKIKTVADLLANFGQMRKECPDFKPQYAVLPPDSTPSARTARCWPHAIPTRSDCRGRSDRRLPHFPDSSL
jgi:hypothetical protein